MFAHFSMEISIELSVIRRINEFPLRFFVKTARNSALKRHKKTPLDRGVFCFLILYLARIDKPNLEPMTLKLCRYKTVEAADI